MPNITMIDSLCSGGTVDTEHQTKTMSWLFTDYVIISLEDQR